MASAQEWKLRTGTARVLPASDQGIVRPVILAGEKGAGSTDLAAFEAGVDHASYSFLAELHARGRDLILVGYNDGDARLDTLADAVIESNQRALAARRGTTPLVVGGIGRGALAARYGLVKREYLRFHQEAAVYFSYNGTAPSQEEDNELRGMGEWPQLPRLLGLASADFTSEISLDPDAGPFDDTMVGAANPGGPLITNELGSWLLERLP